MNDKLPPWLFKGKVDNHEELKEIVMCYIDSCPDVGTDDTVTKSDWIYDRSQSRPKLYDDALISSINKIIRTLVIQLGYRENSFKIKHTSNWFHQYEDGSSFVWHAHNSMFAFVYYAQVPESTGTIFYDPWNKELIQPRVEEGDVVIFPTFIHHKSPKNETGESKIIVAGNFDINGQSNKKYLDNL
jgi:hypothetical protein